MDNIVYFSTIGIYGVLFTLFGMSIAVKVYESTFLFGFIIIGVIVLDYVSTNNKLTPDV